uniref:enoyl-CoA hydratase-related protein n=1 Tax=Bordetella pertussis TaxID=520 RepID=UPI00367132EB
GEGLDGGKGGCERGGTAPTADLFLTARTFGGAEAGRIGLAHEVFADADFTQAAAERVAAVAGNAPLTLRAARLALRHLLGGAHAPSADSVDQAVRTCFDSEDYQEGQAAFREKRPPVFKGR